MSAARSTDIHLGVIGSGVMAEAMIAGLLRENRVAAGQIVCADPSGSRREDMARMGVSTTSDNAVAVREAAVILLSVKPQVAGTVLEGLRGSLASDTLVISIVAGVTTAALRSGLGHQRVVRAMPNTPAQVGAGMTVWFAAEAVDNEGRERTRAILSALGEELEVADEHQVSMATAISGSGPAYVFLYMEALTNAAVHLGLHRDVARRLVVQTVRGSADLARQSGRHMAELRDMVTSPGGTSAAALNRLESGKLRGIMDDAVRAAFQRTIELETSLDRQLGGHGGGPGSDPAR
ncbi:MAG: pyrroline-5-carboxylate reductase [Candidatus Dormibacteria bacterium]